MITIRPATNADGPAIEALLEAEGMHIPGVDWSNNEHFWAVAERDGEIIGCVQIVGSRPVGYLHFFTIEKRFQGTRVTWKLGAYAIDTLRKMGSQAFMWLIPNNMEHWQGVAEKIGAEEIHSDGKVYVRGTQPLVHKTEVIA